MPLIDNPQGVVRYRSSAYSGAHRRHGNGLTLRLNVYELDPNRWFLIFRAGLGMH